MNDRMMVVRTSFPPHLKYIGQVGRVIDRVTPTNGTPAVRLEMQDGKRVLFETGESPEALPLVPTLSLLQPWASLVAIGAKCIETRSWRTDYRGPLLIASSKGFSGDLRRLTRSDLFFRALTDPLGPNDGGGLFPAWRSGNRPYVDDYLPLGSILCRVDLTHCVRITPANTPPEPERSFGDYTPGRYAWHLANVRRLDRPVPAKGSLGLWTPDSATLAAVMEQLKEVA